MINNRKVSIIFNIIGIIALFAIAGLIVLAIHLSDNSKPTNEIIAAQTTGSISFDSDELIFDGTSQLDLMTGVYADDGNGNDITSTVNAVITADGTLNRKTVRYTCFDANGLSISATRTLVMKNYQGPALNVTQPLQLDAANLKDLITYMQTNNLLVAHDGFGKNITSRTTCLREPVSEGNYKMTFRIANDYLDEKTVTVYATVSGKVDDPTFELYSNTASVPMGEIFEPMNFVVSQASCVGKIDVDSNVDTMKPGKYRVIYTAYSTDRSAKITKTMQVTVTGEKYG